MMTMKFLFSSVTNYGFYDLLLYDTRLTTDNGKQNFPAPHNEGLFVKLCVVVLPSDLVLVGCVSSERLY